MVDTLRDENDLASIFADGVFREHSAQKVRDFITSVIGVGGVMACQDVLNASLLTSYQPFSFFTASSDTKGLADDLTQGLYIVQTGAAGDYALDVSMGVVSDFDGWVQIALVRNSTSLLFGQRRKRSFLTGAEGSMDIVGGGRFAEGDTIGVAIRSNIPGTIGIEDGTFRATRI